MNALIIPNTEQLNIYLDLLEVSESNKVEYVGKGPFIQSKPKPAARYFRHKSNDSWILIISQSQADLLSVDLVEISLNDIVL